MRRPLLPRCACRSRFRATLAFLAVFLACPAAQPAPAAAPPTVLLLSLDGARPADVAALPLFRRLAERGAAADGLVPVFPSNTFPNHVTFVTGVEPDRHGIVNNAFRDPARGLFRYDDDPTWLEAEPLWALLARAGIPSASYHWVGSEGAWRDGLGPRHWERFDSRVPARRKVDRILAWLDLADPAERPRFVTCWLRGADATGHRHGPGTEESAEALREQEAALAELVAGLETRGLLASTTLLLVSDHGMARVARTLDLEKELRAAGVRADVIGGGGFATVRLGRGAGQRKPAERRAAVARAVEVAGKLGLEAHARGDTPASWPTVNARFGDLVVLAPVGTAIVDGGRALAAPAAALGFGLQGAHGHHPEAPEMAGIFFALGRGVEPGARPGRVRALDVAPTVLSLLGLAQPAAMAGRPIPLQNEKTEETAR
jgi:arylsulfatase A-like enzyme